jgi:hypothetical protein
MKQFVDDSLSQKSCRGEKLFLSLSFLPLSTFANFKCFCQHYRSAVCTMALHNQQNKSLDDFRLYSKDEEEKASAREIRETFLSLSPASTHKSFKSFSSAHPNDNFPWLWRGSGDDEGREDLNKPAQIMSRLEVCLINLLFPVSIPPPAFCKFEPGTWQAEATLLASPCLSDFVFLGPPQVQC